MCARALVCLCVCVCVCVCGVCLRVCVCERNRSKDTVRVDRKTSSREVTALHSKRLGGSCVVFACAERARGVCV